MQVLDAQREQVQAQGNLRTAAPGTTFSLLDHAEHDGSDDERDRFIILSAQHRARSNLSADHQAQVNSLLGAIDAINTKRAEVESELRVSFRLASTALPDTHRAVRGL
jgi:uncharacterized protein involved in type VI secretion and phage assembly